MQKNYIIIPFHFLLFNIYLIMARCVFKPFISFHKLPITNPGEEFLFCLLSITMHSAHITTCTCSFLSTNNELCCSRISIYTKRVDSFPLYSGQITPKSMARKTVHLPHDCPYSFIPPFLTMRL